MFRVCVHAGDNLKFPTAPVALELDKEDDSEYDELNGKKYADLHALDKSKFDDFKLQVTVIPQATELQTGT